MFPMKGASYFYALSERVITALKTLSIHEFLAFLNNNLSRFWLSDGTSLAIVISALSFDDVVRKSGARVKIQIKQECVVGVFGDFVIAGRQLHADLSIDNADILAINFYFRAAVRADENHFQGHFFLGGETQYRARFHFQSRLISDTVHRNTAFAVAVIATAYLVKTIGRLVVAEMTFVALLRAAIGVVAIVGVVIIFRIIIAGLVSAVVIVFIASIIIPGFGRKIGFTYHAEQT